MKKTKEHETFLLENWGDTAKLINCVNDIEGNMASCLQNEVKARLIESEWWDKKQFEAPMFYSNYSEVGICKKSWKIGTDKWDHVSLWVGKISLDGLMGTADEHPNAGIWSEKIRTKIDKPAKFAETFNLAAEKAKNSFKGIKIESDNDFIFYYELKQSPDEWIEILRKGTFAENIMDAFNNLALFIEPIDRALSEVRRKA
ncbi:hypothetical protein A2625_03970 [candidate division WOR-1 bacterium RIFCSPHIGHO2_01_FULL_53_15]|uniref:Uncharacterized protein n=1 Tax=candidate division WOR-1 bacterium RIFCSPHIGHO2_01_FULL_53_15 TaxID=1802564 RepID=A0A1F4Q028_UNCSA|nr:MAG: hypothetical protein A2625_03970 [candidate division WOR-1 bacterium RIFCSPHIGHO2_01_FULL_53_15]OGC12927.1 MAG: hypothetical protein A3D23_05005 [candidate division WOR-1 bacterium RIFCSPHIGHO2_02_FULL_53_26]